MKMIRWQDPVPGTPHTTPLMPAGNASLLAEDDFLFPTGVSGDCTLSPAEVGPGDAWTRVL